MIEQTVVISNTLGLHARPATLLVQLAGRAGGEVQISKDGQVFNAKSMMALMRAAIKQGDSVIVRVQGEGDQPVLQDMVALIQAGFNEK